MKIAFVGKGGSGKTTLSSLFIRHLAANEAPVVAVDADINQHLGAALGLDEAEAAALPAMGAHLPLIKDYLRGSNPRIASAETMIKTTPPGEGSRLLRDHARTTRSTTPAPARVRLDGGDVRLMATGPFTESDLGVACYHSKVGAVELCLNHLVDGRDEYVVVDMTAGIGLLRLRDVHPLRHDVPGRRADPEGRLRLPPVQGVRAGLRRRAEGRRQQGAGPGRPGLPPRRGRATTCWSPSATRTGCARWRRAARARFELLEADNREALHDPAGRRGRTRTSSATGSATRGRWCTST